MQPFSSRLSPFVRHTKYFQLRKLITILLLTNFLLFQYARQVSYWECSISNYFRTETQKCDCEKLIKVVAGQTKSSPVSAVHNHFHLDESFYPSASITDTGNFYTYLSNWCVSREIFIGRMISRRLDRPPQTG